MSFKIKHDAVLTDISAHLDAAVDPDAEEKYLAGLKDSASFTLSGQWSSNQKPTVGLFVDGTAPVVFGESRRLFGVEWWAERRRFTAKFIGMEWHDRPTPDGEVETYPSLSMSADSPVVVERASWWRRLGYMVVRLLPQRDWSDDSG